MSIPTDRSISAVYYEGTSIPLVGESANASLLSSEFDATNLGENISPEDAISLLENVL